MLVKYDPFRGVPKRICERLLYISVLKRRQIYSHFDKNLFPPRRSIQKFPHFSYFSSCLYLPVPLSRDSQDQGENEEEEQSWSKILA